MANEYDYVFNKLIKGETIKLINHIDIWENGKHRAVFEDDPEYEKLHAEMTKDD